MNTKPAKKVMILSVVVGILWSSAAFSTEPDSNCTLESAWDTMPLRIYIRYSDFQDDFGWSQDQTRNLFMWAARHWMKMTGANIKFETVNYTGNRIMTVGTDGNLPYNVIAEVVWEGGPPFYPNGTVCNPRTMVLNPDHYYMSATASGNGWGRKILHEFGHTLGLELDQDEFTGSSLDSVMTLTNDRAMLGGGDITKISAVYGKRSHGLYHWMYPWAGAWATLGQIAGANTNLQPSVADVTNSANLCVAYADDSFWTRIKTKKGFSTTWTTATTSSYTNHGVSIAHGNGTYLTVYVREINTVYGDPYSKVYFRTSTDCVTWSSAQEVFCRGATSSNCRGVRYSSISPSVTWNDLLQEFIVVTAEHNTDGTNSNYLNMQYYDPSTGIWRDPWCETQQQNRRIQNQYGEYLRVRDEVAVSCTDNSTTCSLRWVDDNDRNSGNIISATLSHPFSLYYMDYIPSLSYFSNSSFGSAFGVGKGTYFNSDPNGYRYNYLRIVEDDSNLGSLKFYKYSGIFQLVQDLGMDVWGPASSCVSDWWGALFVVATKGTFSF